MAAHLQTHQEAFMKTGKTIVKRIILIAAAVIVVLIAGDILLTEITAKKIPHRFASAEEGRDLLLSNTGYYDHFTQIDIDIRMKKSGATMDELLKASTDEIRNFNIFEKYLMDRHIAKMARSLKKNHYELPKLEEIVYIKTDMAVEMGASGYTHGNEIYLNSVNIMFSIIPGAGEYFDHLLWHELFHCLTRNNPDFRADMYSLIHFTVEDSDYELPPCVREKFLSNPDVEHHDAHAAFIIDGEEKECFVAWIATMDYTEAQSSSESMTATALIPIDGTDIYYTKEQASNFDEVFGTNTAYTIDPEECMADNFADAMQYGMDGKNSQGYPNPEIIRGVIDWVSTGHFQKK